MRKLLAISLFVTALAAQGQQAEVIKLSQLQELIQAKADHIKVINFWATWCAPCIKELPLFENLGRNVPM